MDEEKKEKTQKVKEEKPKKQKKVKVVYDVDGKMKKKRSREAAGFGKWNIVALIILLILEAFLY